MVGVSSPMMRGQRPTGWRFIAGFGGGLAAATAMLTGPLLLLTAAASLLPELVRAAALVVLVVGFGLADLLNRTPHVWRQVPQRFARELNQQPGQLGLIWAFDLGLLVTTQKTTSLLWIGLAGAILVGSPTTVVLTLVAAAATYWLGISILVVTGGKAQPDLGQLLSRLARSAIAVRRLAGAAGLGLAAALAVTLP
jgi:hypothetical protein